MILRCTRKLLTVLGSAVAEPTPAPDPEDWYANLLAKTAGRSVLGCMNDMTFRCEHAVRRLAV